MNLIVLIMGAVVHFVQPFFYEFMKFISSLFDTNVKIFKYIS